MKVDRIARLEKVAVLLAKAIPIGFHQDEAKRLVDEALAHLATPVKAVKPAKASKPAPAAPRRKK